MKIQKPWLSLGLLVLVGFILSKQGGRKNREQTLRRVLIELVGDEIHLSVWVMPTGCPTVEWSEQINENNLIGGAIPPGPLSVSQSGHRHQSGFLLS